MALHRTFAVGIVTHDQLGVLVTQSQVANGSWSFIPSEIDAGEDWRNNLYLTIKQKTWIEHIKFCQILWIQSFPEKIYTPEPAFISFIHLKTDQPGHQRGYHWVKDIAALDKLALFNPLARSLIVDALNMQINLEDK